MTINLGGIVHHIDDDAYRLLDDYLSNLKHLLSQTGGAEEIVNDIEIRIAELFAEKVSAGNRSLHCRCGRNNCPGRQTGRFWHI